MAKKKALYHGKRPCVVFDDSPTHSKPPLVIEYTDDHGGYARVSADDLTTEEPVDDE